MLYTKLICGVCGSNLMLDGDTYICTECGNEVETTNESKKQKTFFDGYWTAEDERQINNELDDYFYNKYPQFRKK